MTKHKNQPADEPKPEDALSDVPSFRLGKPDQLLSEMSYEELLAEAQRYHLVEQAGNEMLAEKENKIAELQAELDLLKDAPIDIGEPGGLILNAKEAVDPLGMGARTQIPVFLKKMWGRNIPGIAVGSCIGYAVLPDGVDLNLFIDAIRNGVAGEA